MLNFKNLQKFLVAILMPLAAIVVPVWMWNVDRDAKALLLQVSALIEVNPIKSKDISGVDILVDGARLINPYLVVFKIENNGGKPIPSGDFETPLRFDLENGSKLVRANVTERVPRDVEISLASDSSGFTVALGLLNPGDVVMISAITDGEIPRFSSKARVVGISNVVLRDGVEKGPNNLMLVIYLFGATLFLVCFWLVSDFLMKNDGVFLRRRAAAFIGFSAIVPTLTYLEMFVDEIGLPGRHYLFLIYAVLMVPSLLIALFLNQRRGG